MNPLLGGLLIGVAFGAILFASGLADPRLIVGMLRLRDLRLLRVLSTALAVGIVGIALLSAFGAAHTSIKTLHVVAILAGGALFGTGFAITGYCPGTSLAAAAAGRRDAFFVIAGGLVGTGVYALAYSFLKPRLVDPASFGKPTLFSWMGVPALALALPIGAACAWLVLRWWRAEHRAGPTSDERVDPRASSWTPGRLHS